MDTFEDKIPNEEEQSLSPLEPTAEEELRDGAELTQAEDTAEDIVPAEPADQPEAAVEDPAPEQEAVSPQEQPADDLPKVSPYADSPYVVSHPVQQKPVKKRKKSGIWKTLLCAVLILGLIAGASGITAYAMNRQWQQRLNRTEESFQTQMDQLQVQLQEQFQQELREQLKFSGSGISVSGTPNVSADGSLTPAQVYAKNVKSVVMIYNVMNNGTATGSGFILSEQGHVVTNHHVIEGSSKLMVVTYDGREYPATLIGSDSTNDVALLKVEGDNLQPVTVGNSDALIVGDQVVAIGNPLGELTSTLTVGYISAKERDVNTEGFAINMLQTDAAINSGNSGGPLFNMRGEVIGITTAKYSGTSPSGASIEGVGFAIPFNDVSDLLSDLMNYGYVNGAYLGVLVSDMDSAIASYYNMPVGVYVQSVEEGFSAQRAGICAKDIIVKLGDIEVTTVNELTRALRKFQAGDEVEIVIYRSGGEMKLSVVLDPKPATE